MTLTLLVVLVVIAALAFDFSNGWHDCANAVATVISTRVLTPAAAIMLAATLNFLGALAGQAVAKTIMKGIVDVKALHLTGQAVQFAPLVLTLSAVLSAIVWNILTVRRGLPASSSHAIMGGLIGASVAYAGGLTALHGPGIEKVLLFMLLAPLFGFLGGFVVMAALSLLIRDRAPSRVNRWFGLLQLGSVSFMAFSHGQNDAQKAMGIITLALAGVGMSQGGHIPTWVVLACATAMALGTAAGGMRVIRTLGVGLLKLQPVHGFAAETAAATVLMFTAHSGLPVSTTQVITASIMGVGSTRRLSAVRWGLGRKIAYAWLLTFPFTILASGLICLALTALLIRG
ncbi:MAG: inorganic phosphate transporter [Candidatus Eisenbacteria bacterium]|nr:inorganic phosphate transporter [Candidatus Eisenbacteria bacterium]